MKLKKILHINDISLQSGDLWGGLAAMLVALPSSIAYGVLIFSALGPEYAGQGALAGITGAAVLGITASLFGRTKGLISAPCAPAAAVLTALAAGLAVNAGKNISGPSIILQLIALTVLFSAGFQILYGVLGGGRLIKFIPFPVVCGYLSGVGVLIALGQLPKLFGLSKGTPLIQGILSPEIWKWQGLVVGLITMVIMFSAPRISKKIPPAILGLTGGMLTYFILALFSPDLIVLKNNPLLIGPIQTSGSFLGSIAERFSSLFSVSFESIKMIFIPALTLSALLSIDTLKTCVVLDFLTHNRHNSDRELMGQGIGNLVSFFTGGIPGAGTIGPTLINVNSGGRSPFSGVIEGFFVILAFLLLGRFIAWVPIGALAGILLVMAWIMFDKSMFRLLKYPSGRLDFAVIICVIFVAVTVDLIAASGVGIALSILLFIRDQIKGTVTRRKLYLDQISSKTRRLGEEREILDKYGSQGVFCELQGNLFFGTTDQLFSHLEHDLRTKKYILFDMRRVQSIDYTAAHLFEQMKKQLTERGGCMLFSGMPSQLSEQRDFSNYLSEIGVVTDDGGVVISDTLDGALEWMEERIIDSSGFIKNNDEHILELKDISIFREFDKETFESLAACMREKLIPSGQKVFSQGDSGDEIFFIRRGSVRILLPLEGGNHHHLATFGKGDFFGEISFLDKGVRSADAEAKTQTELSVIPLSKHD